MATKKKGNPKYRVENLTDNTVILEMETKKATLEWLLESFQSLETPEEHKELAKSIYGDNVVDQDFPDSSFISLNEVGVTMRFKKIIKNTLWFKGKEYKISIEPDKED